MVLNISGQDLLVDGRGVLLVDERGTLLVCSGRWPLLLLFRPLVGGIRVLLSWYGLVVECDLWGHRGCVLVGSEGLGKRRMEVVLMAWVGPPLLKA